MISVRHISAIQLKKFCRKGFQLYAAHILEAMEDETPRLEDFHVLQEFRDVFPVFLVFLDDSLIYSKNDQEHEEHLRLTLQLLREH